MRAGAAKRTERSQATSHKTARRPRAAGRRLGPRRGPSRIRWERLGRIALTLTLALVCFSYFNPAINLLNAYQAKNETGEKLQSLQAVNERLDQRADSLDNPSVLTREARRQGLTIPGERPYVISNLGG